MIVKLVVFLVCMRITCSLETTRRMTTLHALCTSGALSGSGSKISAGVKNQPPLFIQSMKKDSEEYSSTEKVWYTS